MNFILFCFAFLFDFISFYFISFHFISFYFILFYLIVFNFVLIIVCFVVNCPANKLQAIRCVPHYFNYQNMKSTTSKTTSTHALPLFGSCLVFYRSRDLTSYSFVRQVARLGKLQKLRQ